MQMPILPQGESQSFLLRRGQAVLEELDRHALDLLENDFAVCADDEGGVVIVGVAERFFAANDEELLVRRDTNP